MKYRIALLMVFALNTALAQDNPKKFELGFGGGLNYSIASLSSPPGSEIALPGFSSGLVANYHIVKKIFINGQVSYLEQSTKYKNDFFAEHLEVTDHYSWISTPVHFNYTFLSDRFFVGLGLAPQRLLNSHSNYVFESGYLMGAAPISGNISTNNAYNEWTFSGSSRAGVQFPLKQGGRVLIVLSYAKSLNDIRKRNPSTSTTFDYLYAPSNLRLNSFTLEVNYVY